MRTKTKFAPQCLKCAINAKYNRIRFSYLRDEAYRQADIETTSKVDVEPIESCFSGWIYFYEAETKKCL